MKPIQWEYFTAWRSHNSSVTTESFLNEIGLKGWELCGVMTTIDTTFFYFKRQKQNGKVRHRSRS